MPVSKVNIHNITAILEIRTHFSTRSMAQNVSPCILFSKFFWGRTPTLPSTSLPPIHCPPLFQNPGSAPGVIWMLSKCPWKNGHLSGSFVIHQKCIRIAGQFVISDSSVLPGYPIIISDGSSYLMEERAHQDAADNMPFAFMLSSWEQNILACATDANARTNARTPDHHSNPGV